MNAPRARLWIKRLLGIHYVTDDRYDGACWCMRDKYRRRNRIW
jgi:hypothetical protein